MGFPASHSFAYLGDLKLTTDFDPAGRFCTRDRGTLLAGGLLRFAERSKGMMKIGGENVAASEVEAVIASVTGVAEVGVVGRPDRLLDELPAVFVIAEYGRAGRELAGRHRPVRRASAPFQGARGGSLRKGLARSLLVKVAKHELRRMARRRCTPPVMHSDAQHRRFAAPTTPHESRNANLTVFGDYIDRLSATASGTPRSPISPTLG